MKSEENKTCLSLQFLPLEIHLSLMGGMGAFVFFERSPQMPNGMFPLIICHYHKLIINRRSQ